MERRCDRCGYPLAPNHQTAQRGFRPHGGRGLCVTCLRALSGTDDIFDYPPLNRTRDDVLDEWHHLRTDGVSRRAAAHRIGITVDALECHIRRGRASGDPRAVLGNP